MDGTRLQAFLDAAELASGVLTHEALRPRWDEPSALEDLSVGGLAGHLYGSVRRLEAALDEPIPTSPVLAGVADFYGPNRVDEAGDLAKGLHPLIRQEGERRARYGAGELGRRFAEVISRLEARLRTEPPDRLIPVVRVPDGVASLEEYLATRVIELVVHSDDLATSISLPPLSIPPTAASVAIEIFVELARARAGDLDVIRAFTRSERSGTDILRVL